MVMIVKITVKKIAAFLLFNSEQIRVKHMCKSIIERERERERKASGYLLVCSSRVGTRVTLFGDDDCEERLREAAVSQKL